MLPVFLKAGSHTGLDHIGSVRSAIEQIYFRALFNSAQMLHNESMGLTLPLDKTERKI